LRLSLGYLTTKQKIVWDLKNKGCPEAGIAKKLHITRQTVHKALDTANIKIGEALQETAKINKLEIQKFEPEKGYLLGYSSHFKTQTFITFSAKNGIQVWYKHEGDCTKCSRINECRAALLQEIKDRNFIIFDETSKVLPSKLAEALFSKIIGEPNEPT
jgi:hypothetical protein